MITEDQQYDEYAREKERMEIIKTKIHYSWDELTEMSHPERIIAMLQMKQDETMKWQRLSSQLYYYITIISIIVVALGVIVLLNKK